MADHAELVVLGVGHHDPRHVVGLTDVELAGAQPLQPSNQRRLVVFRGRGHIEMHAVLGRLGVRNPHKHQRQLAGLGRIIIGGFDHHLVGRLEGDRPRQRSRPEPGQPGRVGGVNDEMDHTSRHSPTVAVPDVSDKRQRSAGQARLFRLLVRATARLPQRHSSLP
jgi:hypothetical protein